MPGLGVAGYIAGWQPSSSVPPRAAEFARAVVAAAGPGGRERAKNLLWAAGKLAGGGFTPDYAAHLAMPFAVIHDR